LVIALPRPLFESTEAEEVSMARRARLFGRELSDEEAAHLLKQARRGKNAVVRHGAMLLFASFQGQRFTQISAIFRASATKWLCLSTTSISEAFGPWTLPGARADPHRIDLGQRTEIVNAALARPRARR
jgi:hypothetical protein